MRTTNYENFEELLSNKVNRLAEFTFNGKWNEVEKMYNVDPACHTATIDDFVGTALHVAVDLDEEVVVEKLVNAIMRYETKEALQMRNVRGDTALHVAASRGFTKICQIIVGENRERIYLVNRKNNDGETPLFQAALNWKKQAFAYLSDLYGHSAPLQDLVRYNGDSILHCAIRNEYFDLAVIILHYYDFLGVCMNKDGELPLKVLATKPSAFYSSTYLSLLRRVQYLRVHVEPFEPEREMRAILREMKPQKLLNENCPRNYAVLTSAFTGLFGFFGLSAGETSQSRWLEEEEEEEDKDCEDDKRQKKGVNKTKAKMIDKKETPFLEAARNGIIEMVKEMFQRRPSVVHETNSQGENVLLVAAKNRKPAVIESLKEILKCEVWRTLCMAINKDGKTVLHMAGEVLADDMHSKVSYSALEMVWDAKWFQYVASLVPRHYYLLRDKDQKIPWEIFKKTHDNLRKESGEWLKETSESCSVVTALVAAASFATATTVPGGIDDHGMPHFEGKPAFDAFVFSSLFGLCFSVSGLIMFLTVITSRKLPREYRKSLPLKLAFGLSFLFLSIIALLASFCIGHSFLFNHKYKKVIFPIYVATCFPVIFFALDQVQLYVDLLAAIFSTVPNATDDDGQNY
ncbi:uncharacterized protein HKW66_Vig0131380 [Vigna angularis]|uniref:PGG domain-containing protein n=1 Tax=Phaseolus angularis TaxID=3914 RepID=A0A8T0K1X7_PHAAN|nr:uncharacterized protein HKW66_Vig0131380 [Vigna angularis]